MQNTYFKMFINLEFLLSFNISHGHVTTELCLPKITINFLAPCS